MTTIKWIFIFNTLFPIHTACGATQEGAEIGYLWQAELNGPTQRCNVPKQIKFVVADAIIGGEIRFGKIAYFPRGRLEDTKDVEFSLIRFYDDKRPLITVSAKADGAWNGMWTSRAKGCAGKARVLPRRG
jgi:hypothetical protein